MFTLAIVASGLAAGVCLIGADLSSAHGWAWESGFAVTSVVFAVLSIRAALGTARVAIGGDIHTIRRSWSQLLPSSDRRHDQREADRSSSSHSQQF